MSSLQPLTRRVRPGSEFAVDAIARLARQHGAIDLGLGAPDYPPPAAVVEAAAKAVQGHFGYPDPWGTVALRQAVADSLRRHHNLTFDPNTEITITCGATEALFLALAIAVQPGEEVICFEPCYEGFAPAILACEAVPHFVRLERPAVPAGPWSFDAKALTAACNPRTKAILLNSPHNPTGKVFTSDELQWIAELCQQRGLYCICDEVYDHLVFDGRRHISMMQLDGMREQTFLLGSLSKTFGVPGWRLGYVAASPLLTSYLRALNDVTAGGVASGLQEAAITALQLPASYFAALKSDTERRRGQLCRALENVGMKCFSPEGAWYVLADIRSVGYTGSDADFIRHLVCDIGVAAAPGSAFSSITNDLVRFCFGKSDGLLAAALERLGKLKSTAVLSVHY